MAEQTIGMIPVAIFLMRLLVGIFLLGIAGSAIVVLISFVEDFRELFTRD